MKKITPVEKLPSFPKQISNSFWKSYRFANEGAYWSIPVIALEVATAQKGEMLPTLAGRGIGMAIQPVASGMVGAALTFSLGLPPVAAAFAATLIVGYASTQLENSMIRGIKEISKVGALSSTVLFGGNYTDTQSAQQRRQRAAVALAGAMPTSRRWLGQEAQILHR